MYRLRKILLRILAVFYKYTVSRDNKVVIFGALNGNYYGDNSMHVFEWVLKNRPDLKPIWLTRSEKVYCLLKKLHYPVALSNSIEGVKILYKSKIALFTNSFSDFSYDIKNVSPEMKLIALRHGRSVKRIRFARKEHKISYKETILRRKEGEMIKFAISTSDFISDLQEECLQIGRDKHIVTGYPRNDIFFNESSMESWNKFLNGGLFERVVLYAPSWRHGRESTKFFPFDDFNKYDLFEFLRKNNILLLLRPHVNDLRNYNDLRIFLTDLAQKSDNIKFVPHDLFPDVNSILSFVDILISDYSALYHDFLLLDRPMMFIPYDYIDFENQNGFLYDYYSNLPGPAINTFFEFCNHLQLLCNGDDPFFKSRNELKNKVHTYVDANSSARVVKLIDQLLFEN